MNVLTLILLVALAVCGVVAARNFWQLTKAGSRSEKFHPLAKMVAGLGGILIISPLVIGVHGWELKLFVAGGAGCLLCYLLLLYRMPGPMTGRRRR
jgi:hypothetical protein